MRIGDNPAKRLLKVKQAAVYLSLSTKKLRRLVQAGSLPVIRGGANTAPWLLDVRDLDTWIERNKETL